MMHRREQHAVRGALWAVASSTAYSLSSVVGKDLLDQLGPASLLFWRFVIAAAVLWVAVLLWQRAGGPDPMAVPRGRALALGVMFGLLVLVGFLALDRLDASLYIVLVYLYPVFVVVGSSLLGTRPPPLTWLALAIVMVGVVMTVPELFTGVGDVSAVGVALTLAQAVIFAAYMIINARVMPREVDGVVTAAWIMLGASLVVAPIALLDGLVVPRGGGRVFEVALFALIPTVVSGICFFRAMRYIAPGAVAMVLTVEVALVILWSVLFLGEEVRAIRLAGATVLVGGVLLAQLVNIRESRINALLAT
ncbi:MAG: DMT family transporter [Actinobacteria bacterium]|nr:DMT family transporter [Actinomycetota bacterium]